jgi:hypothetical protein
VRAPLPSQDQLQKYLLVQANRGLHTSARPTPYTHRMVVNGKAAMVDLTGIQHSILDPTSFCESDIPMLKLDSSAGPIPPIPHREGNRAADGLRPPTAATATGTQP